MKKILPHLIVPSLVLVFVVAFIPLSGLVERLGANQKRVETFEYVISNKPKFAEACGTELELEIEKGREKVSNSLNSALFKVLVGAGFGLFLISAAREYEFYKKLRDS